MAQRGRFINKLLGAALVGLFILPLPGPTQELQRPPTKYSATTVQYDDTFSGLIVAIGEGKITVLRNILGKPEKRTFLIKPDTKSVGKMKLNTKATVGFLETADGDVARLIVARPFVTPSDPKSRSGQRHQEAFDSSETDFEIELTRLGEPQIDYAKGIYGIPFSGSYMVVGADGSTTSESVSGTTPSSYYVSGSLVSVSFQRQDAGGGGIRLRIKKGQITVKDVLTMADYGVVAASTR